MKKDLLNLSTDLRRISDWIVNGDIDIAQKFINICREKYSDIPQKIGSYKNIWKEIDKIEKLEGGKDKAAERASTASVILLNNV